jgi:hypothetical protein
MIHIPAEMVENHRPQVAQRGIPSKPIEEQRQMQHDQLETSV